MTWNFVCFKQVSHHWSGITSSFMWGDIESQSETGCYLKRKGGIVDLGGGARVSLVGEL